MSEPDSTGFLVVFFIGWGILAGLQAYYWILGGKFFGLLSEKFPDYYSKIGSPVLFSWNFFLHARASMYLLRLLYLGVPNDFPNDEDARALAMRIRKLNLYSIFLMLGFVVAMALYGFSIQS